MNEFIKNHFPFLTDFINKYHCVEIDKCYDEKNFGNAYLTVGLNNLVFRFVKDRSQYFVNVKLQDESDWHLLDNVFEFLGVDFQMGTKIDATILLLDNNLSKIDTMFSNKEKLSRFIKFEKEKRLRRHEEFIGKK